MAGADCAPPALTPLNPRTDTTRRREHGHIALRPSDVTFDPSPTSAIVRIDRRWNKDWRHRDHSGHRILTTASIVDIVHPGMGTGDAVSIGGSRRYPDLRAVFQEVRALPADTLVLTGATHGVDAAVREAALRTGLELRVYSPRFNQFPATEAAYFARNNDLVGDATRLVSFWDGTSTGTAQAIDHALMLGKPVDIRVLGRDLRRDRRQEDPAPSLTSTGDIAVTSRQLASGRRV